MNKFFNSVRTPDRDSRGTTTAAATRWRPRLRQRHSWHRPLIWLLGFAEECRQAICRCCNKKIVGTGGVAFLRFQFQFSGGGWVYVFLIAGPISLLFFQIRPLSGVKRTLQFQRGMSAVDPFQTLAIYDLAARNELANPWRW
jgi:hypothetical protein